MRLLGAMRTDCMFAVMHHAQQMKCCIWKGRVTIKCYTNVITIIMALFITSLLGVGHPQIAKDSESSVPSEAGLRL